MPQYELELAGCQAGVGRYRYRAGLVGCRIGGDPLQGLFERQVDRHPVALGHTGLDEGRGQSIRIAVPFPEGDLPPARHLQIRTLVGEVLSHEPELVGEQLF